MSNRRFQDPLLGETGSVRLDPENKIAFYKVAYVSPADSKRCSATWAVRLIHEALAPHSGDLISVATEGDRTLFFEVDLPTFDIGEYRARVGVYCASGAVYFRATRRLVTMAACGVIFVPSLVEGYDEDTWESAAHLEVDLALHGVQPAEIPLVLQWLPGGNRPEVSPESVLRGLSLSFLASYSTDRDTGEGIQLALFEVLKHAKAKHEGTRS